MPALPIPPPGLAASYNGVTWVDPYSQSEVSATPEYDPSGRTIIFIRYRLRLKGWVTCDSASLNYEGGPGDAGGINPTLDDMRNKLEHPGGELVFQNRGFGAFEINTPESQVYDVEWGPKPRVLSWRPLGSNMAAFVEWECEVCIPECDSASYRSGILSFTYDVAYSYDQDGYETIRRTGQLTIPLTRNDVGDRTIPGSADAFREQIGRAFPAPYRYRQKEPTFTLSADRRTLNFTITHEETDIPGLPDGVSRAPVTQKVRSDLTNGFRKWIMTFDGSVVMTDGWTKGDAWSRFLAIVGPRLKGTKNFLDNLNAPALAAGGQPVGQLIHTGQEMGEEMNGRVNTFQLSYWLVGVRVEDIFKATGLWQPLSSNYERWKGTVTRVLFGTRGWAGLPWNPREDIILDLCTQQKPSETTSPGSPGPRVPQPNLSRTSTWSSDLRDPTTTWLNYRVWFEVFTRGHPAIHLPLRAATPQQTTPGGGQFGRVAPPAGTARLSRTTGGSAQVGRTAGGVAATPQLPGTPDSATGGLSLVSPRQQPGDPPPIIQEPTAPLYRLALHVSARRVGYPIPIPRLDSFAGVQPVFFDSDVKAGELARAGGVPFYGLEAVLYYVLPAAPQGNMPVMGNPEFDMA